MVRIFTLIVAVITFLMVNAETCSYKFNSTTLPMAIQKIMEGHPDLDINFIYNELENYKTSSTVYADNAYDALRQLVMLNPVTVTKSKDSYYIEALQHGKYVYNGKVIGNDNEPVIAATVMLLTPKDSTVLTYGMTDDYGHFHIPCDRQGILAKLSCVGYKTTYRKFDSFNVGTVLMTDQPIQLKAVTVEGENASLLSDRSVYRPTQRQKNASQSGTDLLAHMAIPQLNAVSGGRITTNSGKPVAIFIDFVPASEVDLKAMRTADVKKVEYYELPSDPRLQGNQYVVNFIMQRYEYGGYVKGFAHANLISFSEQLLGNMRFQYKKMTYDIMGYGFNMNNSHYGSDFRETFRLPQENGDCMTFDRTSKTLSSKTENQQYFVAFRALYNSDKIQASTEIDGSVNTSPHSDRSGVVAYTPGFLPATSYHSTLDKDSRFLSYSGYYFCVLPNNNSLTFTPHYTFIHTESNSSYFEESFSPIQNSASDNTSQIKGDVKFNHNFGKYGNLLASMAGFHEYNRTQYSGTAASIDRIRSSRLGIGLSYNISVGNFYGMLGAGYNWDRLDFCSTVDRSSRPSFDLSLQYAIRKKHSIAVDFHYGTKHPLPSFRSANVITASPFLKYSGNPELTPLKSYDFSVDYTWVPSNNFSLSAFASGWIVGDRYVFNYEATSDGVVRTIIQPGGGYAQGRYGIKGTSRFLDRKLMATAMLAQSLNYNGSPYNINHSDIYGYAQVRYYLGNWNFALTYISAAESPDGSVNGIWNRNKSDWYIAIGWSNSKWNVNANIINFSRWNWRSSYQEMYSAYYDIHEQIYNGSSHALIQVSATYTIGFGKKVKQGNAPSVKNSSSSGILQ